MTNQDNMDKNVVLSIIIVSTNEEYYLRSCLQSITRYPPPCTHEIIIVDNASTDDTCSLLMHVYPHVKIIHRNKNYGFANNNNVGISMAKGKYILLLNPDTEIRKGTFAALLSFMNRYKNAGICGPQLVFPDGSLQYSCRRFPTWRSVLIRRTILRSLFPHTTWNDWHLMKDIDHSKTQKVDWLLGACLLIRSSLIHEIGALDEQYFLYVDDIDFCCRAHRAGWDVYYVPNGRVIHHHMAKSDKSLFSTASWHHSISMLRFALKHKSFLYI